MSASEAKLLNAKNVEHGTHEDVWLVIFIYCLKEKTRMTSAFEIFGHQNAAPVKKKRVIKKDGELDDKLRERNSLLSSYKRSKKQLMATILATDDGIRLKKLLTNLRQHTVKDIEIIQQLIRDAAWLHDLDVSTKRFALQQIDKALSKVFTKSGYNISDYNDDHMIDGMVSESNPFGFKSKLIYKIRHEIDPEGKVR